EDGAQYLVTFLAIKLALATVVLGGFLAVISWRGWSGERAAITLVATAIYFVLTLIALANAFLYAHQAMHYSVLGQSLNPILTLASGALAVWLKQPFAMVLWLSLGASVVQLALALYFCRRFCRRPEAGLRSLVMPGRVVAGMLKTAVSFTALALIAVLNGNVVTLLVRLLTADDRGVGYFAAAQRIQAMAFMIPDMLLLAIFPAFARTYSTAPERFAAMFERAYRYIFLVTVPMAVGLWVVAPEGLDLIYGREFA